MTLLNDMGASKIIAILRGFSLKDALTVAVPLQKAGISFIEIPYSSVSFPNTTPSIIYELRSRFSNLHVGAGTVLNKEQVQEAFQAGAEYILAPNVSLPVIYETKNLGMLSMPGAMTPSEIVHCYEEGADVVKVFPSGLLGPGYINALKAPLPEIPLSAVGGINLNNIQDFFNSGVFCVGIGANMVDQKALQNGDLDSVEKLAKLYLDKISVTLPR